MMRATDFQPVRAAISEANNAGLKTRGTGGRLRRRAASRFEAFGDFRRTSLVQSQWLEQLVHPPPARAGEAQLALDVGRRPALQQAIHPALRVPAEEHPQRDEPDHEEGGT